MSITKMMSLHPDAEAGETNDIRAKAAKHAFYCALFCTSCTDACLAEPMDMTQCIRTCLDCADICTAAAKIAVRQTGEGTDMTRTILEACVRACQACAAECSRHDHAHCKLCAEMCNECAEDCRAALATLG